LLLVVVVLLLLLLLVLQGTLLVLRLLLALPLLLLLIAREVWKMGGQAPEPVRSHRGCTHKSKEGQGVAYKLLRGGLTQMDKHIAIRLRK